MRVALFTVAAAVCATLAFLPDASAQSVPGPTIHNVTLDKGSGVLTITGVGFGRDPVVTVDGQAVVVLQGAAETRLDVLAPATLLTTPGSYRLTVVDPARQIGDAFVVATVSPVAPAAANATGTSSPVSAAAPEAAGTVAVGSAIISPLSSPSAGPSPQTVIEDGGAPYRTALGFQALFANTSGISNVAVGYRALTANTSGYQNTANGHAGLIRNTTGFNNTASGYRALQANTTGFENTASGSGALFANTTGSYNTASGNRALQANTTGANNVATGFYALFGNTTGAANTGIGTSSLYTNTTGNYNVAVGVGALMANTTGTGNTASGYGALQANTIADSNTATGGQALYSNTTGTQNTAGGVYALLNNTTGTDNTASGVGALSQNTTGANNVAVGAGAGSAATTGSNNIYLGAGVLGASGETNAIYLGLQGMATKTVIAGIRGTTLTGAEVVSVDADGRLGSGPLGADFVGSAQVIDNSLTAADLASDAVGTLELADNAVTSAKVNFNYAASTTKGGAATDVACAGCVSSTDVSFSFASLGANTFTGTQTIDTGNLDLNSSTATSGNLTKTGLPFLHTFGSGNLFLGVNAGNFTLIGANNMGVGLGALNSNTDGSRNLASGTSALTFNTTGNDNVAIGYQAGAFATTGSNNIYLGSNVTGTAGETNTIALGRQGIQTKTIIGGIRGTAVTGGEAVVIDVNGRLGSGPIGADSIGSAQVIDNSLTAIDLAADAVGTSELADAAVTAPKVSFNYAGSASKGGAASDLACVGCVAATEVSFGFATLDANTFVGTQTINDGNLDLDASTATTGNLVKSGAPFLHNFGTDNTFLGANAGNFTMTGIDNTATGNAALGVNTSGGNNTATGNLALASNTTGNQNTATGFALTANTTGSNNTAAGTAAMAVNTTGSSNTAIGVGALASNDAGAQNTSIGFGSLAANTTGVDNVAIGTDAGSAATTGANNIYLGAHVIGVTGETNAIHLGLQGTQTTTVIAGIRGTSVSGGEIVSIDANGRLGSAPLGADFVGSAQVIDDSLTAEDLAPDAIGTSELTDNAVTSDKVAFNYAASSSKGGAATNVSCTGCLTSTEILDGTLTANDLAAGAVDTSQLTDNAVTTAKVLDGAVSSAKVGFNYATSSSKGGAASDLACSGCVAAGEVSFTFATLAANSFTGAQTISNGNLDLDASTATTGNLTKNGTRFLHNIGTRNTFLGEGVANFSVTNSDNTAVGFGTLAANTIGVGNIAIGSSAGSAATGSNNIYLGANVVGVADETNTMYLGLQGTQTKTFVAGIFGVSTDVVDATPVMVDSLGQLGTVSSSRRFKEDIHDMADASTGILRLRPVTFSYTQAFAGGVKPRQYGLIAEEVAEVYPDLVVHSADGQVQTVQYDKVNAMLLNEVQKQHKELDAQAEQIRALTAQLAALASRLQGMEAQPFSTQAR